MIFEIDPVSKPRMTKMKSQENIKYVSNLKHGMKHTRTYQKWNSMKNRCFNPRLKNYKNYGGRGISVCESWLKFENFLSDMGIAPDAHSLERIDNDGNYEPGNVRWATAKEQQRNKRNSRFITYRGKTLTVAAWAEELGLPITALSKRLQYGWGVERAFSPKYMPKEMTHLGVTKTISEWARILGVHRRTVLNWYNEGKSIEEKISERKK